MHYLLNNWYINDLVWLASAQDLIYGCLLFTACVNVRLAFNQLIWTFYSPGKYFPHLLDKYLIILESVGTRWKKTV